MTGMSRLRRVLFATGAAALGGLLLLPAKAPAQEEVASAVRRYKDREASTGYYEEYEAKPRRMTPLVEVPGVRRGLFPYSPTAAPVRVRTRLVDSHQGIKFYESFRCEYCHTQETKDIHATRANLTCRQCHGGEPIASIEHYYSPMNPMRKHAFICSKCHEGSGASFASYVVHEPNPADVGTRKTFPVLFYVFWIMVVIAAGTFVVFLPHTVLWGIRELLVKKKEKGEGEPKQ
jgi:hypothetical protein